MDRILVLRWIGCGRISRCGGRCSDFLFGGFGGIEVGGIIRGEDGQCHIVIKTCITDGEVYLSGGEFLGDSGFSERT